jgi:hypothetical protein
MTMRMDGGQGLLQQVLGVRRTMPDRQESSKLAFVRMCEFVHL